MKRRIYGPDRDPVGRHVGDDVLGRALRELCSDAERRLLLRYLHGETPQQLARDLGLGPGIFSLLIAGLLDRLRTSRYAAALRQELSGPRFSAEVWGGAAEVPAHRCERSGCDAPPFPQRPVGRPRRFCSPACRQAAYRERLQTGAGRRPVAGSQPAGPRPARLTDYSAALPVFPKPQALPEWESFRDYLDRAIRRWHAPAVAVTGRWDRAQVWPSTRAAESRSVVAFGGRTYQLSLTGTLAARDIGRLADSFRRRALRRAFEAGFGDGPLACAGAPVLPRRSALFPPTLTSPLTTRIPDPPLKCRGSNLSAPRSWLMYPVTSLVRATDGERLVAVLPSPRAAAHQLRMPQANTAVLMARQARHSSDRWPTACRQHWVRHKL